MTPFQSVMVGVLLLRKKSLKARDPYQHSHGFSGGDSTVARYVPNLFLLGDLPILPSAHCMGLLAASPRSFGIARDVIVQFLCEVFIVWGVYFDLSSPKGSLGSCVVGRGRVRRSFAMDCDTAYGQATTLTPN